MGCSNACTTHVQGLTGPIDTRPLWVCVESRQMWRLSFIWTLLLSAIVIGGALLWRHARTRSAEPVTRVEHSNNADAMLQAECYQQARALYGALGYPRGRIAGFGHHYNQKLGKCFLDVMNMETAQGGTL